MTRGHGRINRLRYTRQSIELPIWVFEAHGKKGGSYFGLTIFEATVALATFDLNDVETLTTAIQTQEADKKRS